MVQVEAQVRLAGREELLAERERRPEGLGHVALLDLEALAAQVGASRYQ